MQIKELIRQFEEKPPHIVFEWKDSETEAEGWVVINSLRGGAAGGGTRMRKGLDRHEVLSLAKTMEIKFAVAGPPIGGAKSGINFDPHDPRKAGVLERWYKAVTPLLKTYYGTGGDLNVDADREVIPITQQYGLQHPQEGVLIGHYHPDPEQRDRKIAQLRQGVSKILTDSNYSPDVRRNYTVADMITGWGVSESVRHYYRLWKGEEAEGKRAIIQGWGNVAAAAAYYLAFLGVRIVGILDRAGGLISTEGLGLDEIRKLFLTKSNNQLHTDDLTSFEETDRNIWDTRADIFIPAAASRLVSLEQLERMKAAGVEVISCGANVPFKDQDIFYGPTTAFADENFALIPDFIANCGMARTFAYLMQSGISLEDEAIFQDTSSIIGAALRQVRERQPERHHLTEAATRIVLEQLL